MRTLLSLSTNVAAVTSVVNQQCKRTTDYTWAKFDLCKCWQPQSDGPSFAEIYLFTTQPDQLHYVLKEIRGFAFQVLGSLSVKLGFRIPKPRIPDSTSKKFPGFYMGRKSANNSTHLFKPFPISPNGSPARPPSPRVRYRNPSVPKNKVPPL